MSESCNLRCLRAHCIDIKTFLDDISCIFINGFIGCHNLLHIHWNIRCMIFFFFKFCVHTNVALTREKRWEKDNWLLIRALPSVPQCTEVTFSDLSSRPVLYWVCICFVRQESNQFTSLNEIASRHCNCKINYFPYKNC